ALAAVDKALQLDPQFAAGHLWRGLIAGEMRRGDEAMKEFADAERLFRVASNVEGQTEALLGRARFLIGRGDVKQAQSVVDTAEQFAKQTDSQSQQVRAAIMRANIAAFTGDLEGARRLATDAVSMARRNQLDTVAAGGLVDVAIVLNALRDNR